MTREYWFFVSGILVVLLPLVLVVAVKKFNILEIQPDQKIVYKITETRELTLHAFMAKINHGEPPPPALVFFHGGRWRFGGPEGFYPQCRYFAAEGFTCFSVQYRLGSDGRTNVRTAIEDAQSALGYLIDHAEELHINRDRIVVGGGSSGGHLAAALGVPISVIQGEPSPTMNRRPAALILYNPMLDLSPCNPDHHLVKDYWQEVSPFHHLDALVPPSLILLGTDDVEVPVSTAEAFCNAVQFNGGHCELTLYEDQRHGFFNYRRENKEYFEKTNHRILKFLRDLWG